MNAEDVIRKIDESGCLDIVQHYIKDDTELEALSQYALVMGKLRKFHAHFKSSIVENLTINEWCKETPEGEMSFAFMDNRDSFSNVLENYPVESMLVVLTHYKIVPYDYTLRITETEAVLIFNDQVWRQEDIIRHTAQFLSDFYAEELSRAKGILEKAD